MDGNGRSPDVTRLLEAWRGGRRDALDQLLPAVYGELRRIAGGQLARARRHHTFEPTELVHEAFVRLVDQRCTWQSRVHFYGIAATCMRRVLADYARRRRALKRPQVEASAELRDVAADLWPVDRMLAIDEALDRLAAADVRQGRVAELKLFTDLQVEEIAGLVGVSPATVKRDWAGAKRTLSAALVERRR
jgi:RNA polymerase sigma factor (TIGR02999 family)